MTNSHAVEIIPAELPEVTYNLSACIDELSECEESKTPDVQHAIAQLSSFHAKLRRIFEISNSDRQVQEGPDFHGVEYD
jgi:hypothetical protein